MIQTKFSRAGLCLLASVFSLALPCAAQVQHPPDNVLVDNTLVAWWPLTEDFGVLAPDYSGNNVVATWVGAPNGTPDFYINDNAHYYGGPANELGGWFDDLGNANSEFVSIPLFSITPSWTLTLWASTAGAMPPSSARLFEGGGGSQGGTGTYATGIYLGGNSVNESYQLIVNNGDSATLYGSCIGGTIELGANKMITATFDGVLTGNAYLYVNGVQVAGPCHFTPPKPVASSARIGCYNNTAVCAAKGGAWNGTINGVRFYNRVLSQAEILQLYTTQSR